MAARSLTNVLRTAAAASPRVEENLEVGEIWSYTPGTFYTNFVSGFCWRAPGTGTAVIEAWGPGGPGARMCCCGYGLPGNSGAYAKKTVTVTSGCYVCGTIGFPAYSHVLCHSGCSDPTGLCWFGSGTNGCVCARGGRGGTAFCSTGTSAWCCYTANGFCGTGPRNDNCGLICNQCSGAWEALAYGGDVNCCGIIGCTSFHGCCPNCVCFYTYHAAYSPGLVAENGAVVSYAADSDTTPATQWSGGALFPYFTAVSALTRAPKRGNPKSYPWRADRSCGCYEMQGCSPMLPIGAGGLPPQPCGDVRDHGTRGGWGSVRIKYIAS